MRNLTIFNKISQGQSIKVVAFGASCTQRFMCGMHWFDFVELGFKNYHGHKVGQFINSGVSNDSTVELLARFENECAAYDPDLVILTVGANDCRLGHSMDFFTSNLQLLREKIRFCESDLLLQTFYPIDSERVHTWWLGLDSYSEVHPGHSVDTPPRHGIGRGLKVGKDVIVGCVTALELYSRRDFASERAGWHACCEKIAIGLEKNVNFAIKLLPENSTGQYPVVRIQCESADQMAALKRKLKTETPKIILAEDEKKPNTAYIYPMCLRPGEIKILIQRVGENSKP